MLREREAGRKRGADEAVLKRPRHAGERSLRGVKDAPSSKSGTTNQVHDVPESNRNPSSVKYF
jgi:hypothetical protein